MSDAPQPTLDDYRWSREFSTRFNDNDVIGHLNNTVYYEAMDSTVTAWLLSEGGYDLRASDVAPVVVTSSCRYIASGEFPDTLRVALRADRVGGTSISWGLGIFRERDAQLLATGTFVHVIVDRETTRPVPVPDDLRARIAAELATADSSG